ncbi:MAG TPA: serine/threonine-protein kinase [Gemmatimonadaceae bacterium]
MTDPERPEPTVPIPAASRKSCPLCGTLYDADVLFCARDGSTLVVPGATDLVGQVIADRYRILERLGEGAMGRVFLAEHVKMGRRCAIKVMNRALMTDHEAIGRFNREATNASRVLHPNVAAIYDFGETSEGLIYLAMEVVEGEPLSAICDRERVLPIERAVDITRQITDGLTAAHDLGIVHRDLKPANIMVARAKDGRDVVKIVDFGIAKGTEGERQEVTRTGFVVGTPEYMSPEQLAGGPLDGRSDLFAVGCILYKMLTGETSFAGTSIESRIQRRLAGAPPRPRALNPDVPPWLDEVTAKALARDPDHRFQSATALRDALVMGMATTSQRRLTMPVPLSRISRRFWFAAGAVAGVTALVSLGMSWHRADHDAAPSVPAAAGAAGAAAPSSVSLVTSPSASPPASAPADSAASAPGTPSPSAAARRGGADSLDAAAQIQLLDAQRRALDVRQRAASEGAGARELAAGDAVMKSADEQIRARRYAAAVATMLDAQRSWEGAERAARAARALSESVAAAAPARPQVGGAGADSPAPPPAPSRAPASPAPVADPLPELRAVLANYASALASRDIDKVREAYPGISAEEAKRWSDVFAATTAVGATLTPSGPAAVSGSSAEIQVSAAFELTYQHGIKGDRNPTATYHATFARDSGGWKLIKLR